MQSCSDKTMLEIRGELLVFLVSVISGVTLRLVYKSIDCFRQLIKHSELAMGIEDLVFWTGSALYVFVQIYYTSNGSIRWYFVLGVVAGVAFCSAVLHWIGKNGKKNLR